MLSEFGLAPRPSYSLVSTIGIVYAVVLALTIASSVGDKHFLLCLQWWFSVQIPLPVLLVADENIQGLHNKSLSYSWLMAIKATATGLALLQSMGFFVWACVEWSSVTNGGQVEPFLPVSVALLASLTLLGILLLGCMARMQFKRRLE